MDISLSSSYLYLIFFALIRSTLLFQIAAIKWVHKTRDIVDIPPHAQLLNFEN